MADLKLSQLIQRAPDGTEYFEVIIPPFGPGDNRKVLLSDLSAIIGGGGTWGSITGTLSNQTDLQNALNAKQALVNSATAITDAASMDLSAIKHTLTTSSATRTFTISYTGDDITLEITLNTTVSVLTFPATTLCRYEGVSSGDNTMTLSGSPGDMHIIAIKKIGSNYRAVGANLKQ